MKGRGRKATRDAAGRYARGGPVPREIPQGPEENANPAKEHATTGAAAVLKRRDRSRRGEFAQGGKAKKWISGAIKHPGRMKHGAAREGVSTHQYMEEHKDSPGSLGRAARLGLRLSAMSKKD